MTATRRSSRRLAKKKSPKIAKRSGVEKPNSYSKLKIDKVLDFKKSSGIIKYLVHIEETANNTWVTESVIENVDLLNSYKKQIEIDSGYSVESTSKLLDSNKRHSRFSKTRAIIALKQPIDSEGSDNEDLGKRGTKRNSNKMDGTTRKVSNKLSSDGKMRKAKTQILLETQLRERLERQKSRSIKDVEAIINEMNHVHGRDCCLMCAASDYRKFLEQGDLQGFKSLFKDWKNIPSYQDEDKPNGLDLIGYAIILEKFQFAEFASKFEKDNITKARPSVPQKYKSYGEDTGSNMGHYGRQAFKKVQESRGNRLGNSAFYTDTNSIKTTFMNVEANITQCKIREYLPYITRDVFKKTDVIDNYVNFENDGALSAYYAASSGNRQLAHKIMQNNNRTFNHLHDEVLKFDGTKKLSNYKRTQILKYASDANNLTPYHCAAIHPSSNYLEEFYEILDAAERLETDALGRDVSFYAAVSETSACLEFLISKGYKISLYDKYKMTPLLQAARFGRSHNVEYLVKHLNGGQDSTDIADSTYKTLNRNRRTALHYAAFFGHPETCSVLLNFHAPVEALESLDKQTPLHYAAKNGHFECVRILIEEGEADPAKSDKFGRNALHLACIAGHLNVVKYLLSIGIDANTGDSSNNHPIHYAAAFGHLKVLHLLIEYGQADPSVTNVWRNTPCSIANTKGHLVIVKYLLQLKNNSIDVNFKDQEGCTILQHAIKESVASDNEMEFNKSKIKLLVSMNADPNTPNLEGLTSLHILAQQTAFTHLNTKGRTPFYPTKNRGYYNSDPPPYELDDMDGINYLLSVGRLLISNGADLNTKSNNKETPLCIAMKNNNHHLVALYIEEGAKFWIDTDNKGNNFLHYFFNLAAYITRFQPHCDMDQQRQDRFLGVAKKIWNLVEVKLNSSISLDHIINTPNNVGYSPILHSVKSVIENQREKMKREKLLIKVELERKTGGDIYGYDAMNTSKLFQETIGMIDVNLSFDSTHFIELMDKVLFKLKINLDTVVALPKDFKEKNPQAKKSNFPALTGYSALHFACQAQAIDLIEFLLRSGANPNTRINADGNLGGSPMVIGYHKKIDKKEELPDNRPETLERMKEKFNVTKPDFSKIKDDTIQILINYGASPYITDSSGISALAKAAGSLDVKAVEAMCKVKPSINEDINVMSKTNETVLMVVLDAQKKIKNIPEASYIKVVKILMEAGADPNVLYDDGDNVLMRAMKSGYSAFVKTVIENAKVLIDHSHQNKIADTALTISCSINNSELLLFYLNTLENSADNSFLDVNHFDYGWSTPLSYVCKNGDLEAAQILLSLGANPNHCKTQSIPLIEAVKVGNIALTQTLLEHGASISQCDTIGNSPLHAAVLSENSRMVDCLLKFSPDVNSTNNKLQTPLHIAIEMTKKQTNRSFRVERSLINKGADLNAVDFFNRTPLHYVFIDSNIIPITKQSLCIKKKVDTLAEDAAAEKFKKSAFTNYVDMFSLNEPTQYGNEKINSWLKEIKKRQIEEAAAEKESKESKEDKIVIFEEEKKKLAGFNQFSWEGKDVTPERFDPIEIVKYLLYFKGIQLDPIDYFGRTPLHYAARVGAFSCTNLLIEKGVNLNIVDTDDNGALQLALRSNYVDYSLMLFNKGAKITKSMVLQNGEDSSTFAYSLSKSLINVAYLVMDSNLSLVELISDALRNGKFHMVEVILQTSEETSLCETVSETGKNLWHVLADFKPFNSEIWENDYLDEFVSKLSTLNISITKDRFGRTPLHYAAIHGQVNLLKQLIHMKSDLVNDSDNDLAFVLEYAVKSRKVDCVKLLLDSGAKIAKHLNSKEKSALGLAFDYLDYDMAELLLENGAETDDRDTENHWSNSVMTACLNKNLKLLKLLIKHDADINKPSNITLTKKHNKKYNILLYPIFIASNAGDEFLKVLLEAGANPNVHGPQDEKKYSKSCFMYNVNLNNLKNIELLLDYSIDLNDIDLVNSRSIFYEFYFWKMLGKKDNSELATQINVPCHVLDKMMKLYVPDINQIDPLTNMTPLEVAIYNKDSDMIERLLIMGANPNIESCGDYEHSSLGYLMNITKNHLPAILHALLQNNAESLKMLTSKSQVGINWLWKDRYGNNILSYITGSLSGLVHSKIHTLLDFVKSKVGNKNFRDLLIMKNIEGLSPALSSYHRNNKSIYDTLLTLDSSLKEYVESNYDASLFGSDDTILPMELDPISMNEIEEYAQIERENLRQQKVLDDLKSGKSVVPQKDETLVVDPYSKLSKIATVEIDESLSIAYNITLMKVELQSWGDYTDTSIYKLAIYFNKLLNIYVLWTRWGPLGKEGQHQKTPYLTKEEAVSEFKSIFKSKTGNGWETHKQSFDVKPGRYEIFEKSHHPRDTIIKDFNFLESAVESQLPTEVLDVMKLVCNFKYLSKVYQDTHMDMPMGQIPQSRIEEARYLLKETSTLIEKYEELKNSYSDRTKIIESKLYAFKIAHKCVAYSRLLPRHGDEHKSVRSLYSHNRSIITTELSKIDDLSYIGFASDVVLAAKHHIDSVNPLDYAYRTLNCTLRSISTSMDCSEYLMIKKYMDSTSTQFQDVVRLYSVNRADEEIRYRPFEKDPNRKLLWHGSRIGNFIGILKQGLRIAPGTTAQNGDFLGAGVYFADTFSKSLNYSTDYWGTSQSSYKIMLLCEVALGSNQAHYINQPIENMETYDSIHGQGSNIPDPNNAIYDTNNVCIPIGPCIPYRPTSDNATPHLNNNEFVVNNINRFKIRYLLVLRESSNCYLCSASCSLKALSEHDVSNYDFREFNNYEKEIVKSYLFHQKKKVQEIYNGALDGFLKSKEYKKTWDTPLDMQKEDKICKKCCFRMVSNMLESYILKNQDSSDIIDDINKRPRCKYGKECHTQSEISHSKHYSHWLFEKIQEKVFQAEEYHKSYLGSGPKKSDELSVESSDHGEDSEADDMDTEDDVTEDSDTDIQ